MMSPLGCLVALVYTPRILIKSLCTLKYDVAATLWLSLKLIIINLMYGDHLAKVEDTIRGGKSSAFFFFCIP